MANLDMPMLHPRDASLKSRGDGWLQPGALGPGAGRAALYEIGKAMGAGRDFVGILSFLAPRRTFTGYHDGFSFRKVTRRMILRLLYQALLFLLPFALYTVYLRLLAQEKPSSEARDHPWTILFGAGLLLVAASFVYWGLTEGEPAPGVYVPPHMEDGRIVPGHMELGAEQ